MALVDRMELSRELSRTISQINQQIEEVKKVAEQMNIDPYLVRDSNANWLLAPLLVAKANALHGLALLSQRGR